jgi:octaheme c-type cytochrome (tetrathionate reductase family)
MLVLAAVALLGAVWVTVTGAAGARGPAVETRRAAAARTHLDHGPLFDRSFADARAVTRRCLDCHGDAAGQVMRTSHWTWLGREVGVPGHDGTMRIGKRNLLNNFCLGIQGNWPSCTRCHAGYGWRDDSFDFGDRGNVDCLVCHDWSGTYLKGDAGYPREGVDLLAVAKSVGYPRRDNCGVCHSFGGGGLGVKHGDLDNSLDNPAEGDDVHMGRLGFLCVDCHETTDHAIGGRSMAVGVDRAGGIACVDCHEPAPQADARLDRHVAAVACETCHIPTYARRVPTKMNWDWSKAGDDGREEDPHTYLKIKGEFVYDSDVVPEYLWYNGTAERYLLGDPIDPEQVTRINTPRGDRADPAARIHPFKVHRARQPYDVGSSRLAQPVTAGAGGYWHDFDWDKALRLGGEVTGLGYSGRYGFAETVMYWPLSHMVPPKEDALACGDCHGESSRLDWAALGYDRDPILGGGR